MYPKLVLNRKRENNSRFAGNQLFDSGDVEFEDTVHDTTPLTAITW
jgi:hypothetical protein